MQASTGRLQGWWHSFTLIPTMQVFTPQQVRFIEELIEKRLQDKQLKPKTEQVKLRHSTQEVRRLIIDNKAELITEFGESFFTVQMLSHFLTKKTKLRYS